MLPGLLILRLLAATDEPSRETERFRLYKFQQPIGVERVVRDHRADGTTEIRASFAFTDRTTTVPLSATLTLAKDGSVRHFQEWGLTSRFTSVDDRVSVDAGRVTIERMGQVTTAPPPPVFFVADGYAPVAITEQLWRYWRDHGRPAEMPLFPSGKASFRSRGKEEVTDDDGKKVTLDRFSLGGLEWGRETIWFDSEGRLVALKAVDAEFDHFEATRTGYSEALPTFVASAAADGMAALQELSGPLRTAPGDSGPLAFTGATLIDATGAPPVSGCR